MGTPAHHQHDTETQHQENEHDPGRWWTYKVAWANRGAKEIRKVRSKKSKIQIQKLFFNDIFFKFEFSNFWRQILIRIFMRIKKM